MALELPDPGFPDSDTGTLVSMSTEYGTLFPVYWFGVEGQSGDTFGSTIYPGDGRGVWVDDGSPPAEDPIEGFGTAGWNTIGHNDCPPAAFETRSSSWGNVRAGYR